MDAILASKFMPLDKTKEPIKKLEKLVIIHDAKKLNRSLINSDRIKSDNESVYYNVDTINEEISIKRITFKYFDYSIEADKVYRYDGEIYEVSP